MSTIRVRAAAFGPVRREDGAGVVGDDPVYVPDTYYYRHLVSDGSLVLVSESERSNPAPAPVQADLSDEATDHDVPEEGDHAG